jgi:predicted 2-oxoglutarate/Fe(II)-dependent dioxygenase YbiX
MIKVNTDTDLIARYDDVIPDDVCDSIVRYIQSEKPFIRLTISGELPWNNSDSIKYIDIQDKAVRGLVEKYRFLLTQIAGNHYNNILYPHFSDLVLWRNGMKMSFHKDDGYQNWEYFKARKYSSVAYLNDNYVGGETVIKYENKEYVSKPKKGSVVFFKSNEECLHCVNEIYSGTRYIFANWFTLDINSCEVYDK